MTFIDTEGIVHTIQSQDIPTSILNSTDGTFRTQTMFRTACDQWCSSVSTAYGPVTCLLCIAR